MSKFSLFVLTVAIVLGSIGPALASAPSIVIDGSSVPADVPALVSDGRVLVPLRGVFERLGASVSYDAVSQSASASMGVRLRNGSSTLPQRRFAGQHAKAGS